MHHPKAMATQTFSALWAGFHQMPLGESRPVWVSVSMAAPHGRVAGGRVRISHSPQPV